MTFAIVVETGAKKVFASALDWPGWSRSARDEEGALEALVVYGRRYREAVGPAFSPPAGPADLTVAERVEGDANTDFGVPRAVLEFDAARLQSAELQRMLNLLEACWKTFDATAERAEGRSLRAGARGGGRSVEKIVAHVIEAEGLYAGQMGGQVPGPGGVPNERRGAVRKAFVQAAKLRNEGRLPEMGPRGGLRWTARYAIRRSAWHALDHTWEIEDRLEPA